MSARIVQAMSGALTRRAVLGGAGALALVACGGSSTKTRSPRGLSLGQAARLANVLYDNLQIGGTTFSVAVQPGPGLGTFSMNGQVDWAGRIGHARLASTNVERAISEVWWTEQ